MYVIDKIIEKTEGSSVDWKCGAVGKRSFPLAEYHKKDSKAVSPGMLAQEVRGLEMDHLLECRWYQKYSELEQVKYNLKDLPILYKKAGRRLKHIRMALMAEYVAAQRERTKSGWICGFLDGLLDSLKKGKIPSELSDVDEYLQKEDHAVDKWAESSGMCGKTDLFSILHGLDQLTEPIYKRTFSSRYLRDMQVQDRDKNLKTIKASKVFEQRYENAIVSIAKRYHPDVNPDMNPTEVLSQLYLEEYAQTLLVKGPLKLELDGRAFDLAPFLYGAILNSQTLAHGMPVKNQIIRNIITVENQANYEAMPYASDTLIIFCHGYFTPRERRFLQKLQETLSLQSGTVSYFHTGDLDYGGVRIFRYIREKIFPDLQPLCMDVEQFECYRDKAEPLEPSAIEKLGRVQEPRLQPLINRMVETGLGIEQENWIP